MKPMITKHNADLIAPWLRIASSVAIAILMLLAMANSANAQTISSLNIGDENHSIHILSPYGKTMDRGSPSGALLQYHGGPVMHSVTTYAIFWLPKKRLLQDGTTRTSLPAHYQTVQRNFLAAYPGHGIANNNTQYYEMVNPCIIITGFNGDQSAGADPYCDPVPFYIDSGGGFGGSYLETSDYPPAGPDCGSDTNCITDAQIQTEIQKVMGLKGWTGGLTSMFLVFTSSGEDSCMNQGGIAYCSYATYCAYHSSFKVGNSQIIYSDEPYLDPSLCSFLSTHPSPNSDPAADVAADAASHELTEAITDPLVLTSPAWQTSYGDEIGDLCVTDFGTESWDLQGGQYLANQTWNGLFFELQTEYDNHTGGCVQVGP